MWQKNVNAAKMNAVTFIECAKEKNAESGNMTIKSVHDLLRLFRNDKNSISNRASCLKYATFISCCCCFELFNSNFLEIKYISHSTFISRCFVDRLKCLLSFPFVLTTIATER